MATQNWYTIDAGDTLYDSRGEINANFTTLQANFEGTTAPSSPRVGQCYFNTSSGDWWVYNASSQWKKVFDVTTYGGLLPLTAGSSYQISNDLYFVGATKRIKNLQSADATTDAANKQDVIDYTDAHTHETGTGNGVQLNPLAAFTSTSMDSWTLMQADASNAIVPKEFGHNQDLSYGALANSATALATISNVHVEANEPKYIFYSAHYSDGADYTYAYWRLDRDATPIIAATAIEIADFPITIFGVYKDTGVTVEGDYDYTLYGWKDATATAYSRYVSLFVL